MTNEEDRGVHLAHSVFVSVSARRDAQEEVEAGRSVQVGKCARVLCSGLCLRMGRWGSLAWG